MEKITEISRTYFIKRRSRGGGGANKVGKNPGKEGEPTEELPKIEEFTVYEKKPSELITILRRERWNN